MLEFHGFGMLFGLFGMLYSLVAVFVVILVIVFLFKSISFMNRKAEADHERNQSLKEMLDQLRNRNDG